MTATESSRQRRAAAGKRWVPYVATMTAAALTAGAVVTMSGGAAGAASQPQAQSVGNFLDATLGNKPLDGIAKLKYANAESPGSESVQNPLDATALNAITLPLTGALQLPELGGIKLGAVNQVASASANGSSYGASGAVSNSGGVSVGGNNGAYPANASIDLCASALTGGTCGTTGLDALGAVKLDVGAVSALAQTPKGYGKSASTQYQIAGLDLDLSSPLLASTLKPVTTLLTGILGQLTTALGAALPKTCTLTPNLDFDGSALDINAGTGAITVSVSNLLQALGLNLNSLPANTDLIDDVIKYLTSADGLAKGIETIVNGLVGPLETALDNCLPGGLVGTLLQTVQGILDTGKTDLENTVNGLLGSLGGASVSKLLDPLTSLLKKLLDIGVNVQPNGPAGTFKSALAATPKQGTPVVAGQTIVRAIEIDLVGDPLAVVALANAAAGPSAAPAVTSSSPAPPTSSAPSTGLPTGVPAGSGTHGGGTPTLPIVLLLLAVLFAGGGAVAFRMRGRYGLH